MLINCSNSSSSSSSSSSVVVNIWIEGRDGLVLENYGKELQKCVQCTFYNFIPSYNLNN